MTTFRVVVELSGITAPDKGAVEEMVLRWIQHNAIPYKVCNITARQDPPAEEESADGEAVASLRVV